MKDAPIRTFGRFRAAGGPGGRRVTRLWPLLCIALVLLAGLDLLTGSGFSLADGVIFWKLRLPRMLTAALAGAALGLSGAQMQAVFRNPLADPHIMGVSGGARGLRKRACICAPARARADPAVRAVSMRGRRSFQKMAPEAHEMPFPARRSRKMSPSSSAMRSPRRLILYGRGYRPSGGP